MLSRPVHRAVTIEERERDLSPISKEVEEGGIVLYCTKQIERFPTLVFHICRGAGHRTRER